MGNQMFQYAYGLYLAKKYKYQLCLDKSLYASGLYIRPFALDIFTLDNEEPLDLLVVDLRKTSIRNILSLEEDECFNFSEESLDPIGDDGDKSKTALIISGYWQSPKFFFSIEDVVRLHFQYKEKLPSKWLEMQQRIEKSNSVMINVRRGDYLDHLDRIGIIDVDYIRRGINYLLSLKSNLVLFIFSDDMSWCRENIVGYENMVFVDETYYDDKFQFYHQLMSSCKYFIIANSTFSWWAAWLAPYKEKIVVAPKEWFANKTIKTEDITPLDWIRL